MGIIKLEFEAGTNIEDAFKEAINLANKLNLHCQFNFNDVLCTAIVGGNIDKGVKEYGMAINHKYKMAFS